MSRNKRPKWMRAERRKRKLVKTTEGRKRRIERQQAQLRRDHRQRGR